MCRSTVLLLGIAAFATAGCRERPPSPTYDEKTIEMSDQMRKIVGAWNRAYQQNRKSPTANDLKPLLKQYGDPDTLLKSPRDGKPLVIVPGFTPDLQPKGDERSIIAYEQTGVNGKRMTIDVRGTVVEMSPEEFSQIQFAGGHKPSLN